MNKPILYRDVPNGRCFRLAQPETICVKRPKLLGLKDDTAFDEGVFVKIGDSHAERVQAGMPEKTIIPAHNQLCLVLDQKYTSRWSKC